MPNEFVEPLITKGSAGVSWGGAIYGFFQGMSRDEIGMWIGIAVAVVGMLLNTGITFYYKRKEDKRRQEEHDLMKTQLRQ